MKHHKTAPLRSIASTTLLFLFAVCAIPPALAQDTGPFTLSVESTALEVPRFELKSKLLVPAGTEPGQTFYISEYGGAPQFEGLPARARRYAAPHCKLKTSHDGKLIAAGTSWDITRITFEIRNPSLLDITLGLQPESELKCSIPHSKLKDKPVHKLLEQAVIPAIARVFGKGRVEHQLAQFAIPEEDYGGITVILTKLGYLNNEKTRNWKVPNVAFLNGERIEEPTEIIERAKVLGERLKSGKTDTWSLLVPLESRPVSVKLNGTRALPAEEPKKENN